MEKDGKIYNNELVCNWINKYEVYVRSVLDMETVSLGSKNERYQLTLAHHLIRYHLSFIIYHSGHQQRA